MLGKWEPIFILLNQKCPVTSWSHHVMNLVINAKFSQWQNINHNVPEYGVWMRFILSFVFVSNFVLGEEDRIFFLICIFLNHVLAPLENDSQRCRRYASGAAWDRDHRGQQQLLLVPPSSSFQTWWWQEQCQLEGQTQRWQGREWGTDLRHTSGNSSALLPSPL